MLKIMSSLHVERRGSQREIGSPRIGTKRSANVQNSKGPSSSKKPEASPSKAKSSKPDILDVRRGSVGLKDGQKKRESISRNIGISSATQASKAKPEWADLQPLPVTKERIDSITAPARTGKSPYFIQTVYLWYQFTGFSLASELHNRMMWTYKRVLRWYSAIVCKRLGIMSQRIGHATSAQSQFHMQHKLCIPWIFELEALLY